MSKTSPFDIENQNLYSDVAITRQQESSSLIPRFEIESYFANSSKNLFDLVKEQTWKTTDGFLNAALGAAFVGMSTMEEVANDKSMMALHFGLGGILGAKIIRTIAEAGNSIYYRNENVSETAVEINLLKQLAGIEGKQIPTERLIDAIDQALIRAKAEPLSEEVKEALMSNPNHQKNFQDLSAKVSEIDNLKLLSLTSVLGIACAVAAAGAMIATNRDAASSITTGAGLIASSISGAYLNASTDQPKNISESILGAVKELNNKYFADLKSDAEANHNLPQNIEIMRQNLGKEISQVGNPVASSTQNISRQNQI